MEIITRFLEKNEYGLTVNGFLEAFGDSLDKEFMDEFYGEITDGKCTGTINRNEIAAVFCDGHPVSFAQYFMTEVVPVDKSLRAYYVPYIMGVCTLKEYRHRGFMDRALTLITDRLEEEGCPWCFLLPVDTAIYRHLGFNTDWLVTDEELKFLYADGDGLYTVSAKKLNSDFIEAVKIVGVRT